MAKSRRRIPDNPREALEEYIEHLENNYYQWYKRAMKVNYYIMLSSQLVALVAGFTTSLLAALMETEYLKDRLPLRIILIVLPFVGSLASTVLIQSHVSERWRLREEGRVSYQALITDARRRYASATKPEEFARIHKDLESKALNIERRQSVRFFEHPPAFIQAKEPD